MKGRRLAFLCVTLSAALAVASASVYARGGSGGGGSRGSGGSGRGQSSIQRRGGGSGGQHGPSQRGGTGYRGSSRSGAGRAGGYGAPGRGGAVGPYQNQYQHQDQYQHRGPSEGRERHRNQGDIGRHRWGYDRTSEDAVSGQVIEGPARGRGEGVENTLRVRTRDGEEKRLQLGPAWYRENLGFNPRPGDEIAAVGARSTEQNQNRSQITARELKWNGRTYRFRNDEGIPLWAGAERPEWSGYASMWDGSPSQHMTGEIEGIEGVSPGGADMGRGVVLRLRTRERERTRDGQQETRRVHLGPYWFVEESMPGLRPGQQVTVRGAPAEWRGEQVVIASEIERNQQRVRFRSREGRPEWAGGWQNWDGWGPGAGYGQKYDPERVQTVSGRVERVDAGTPAEGMGRGLMLQVRTRERERMRAHLGPTWFAEQFDVAPEPGDELTLTGSVVEMNGRRAMMVREVVADQRRVRVREEDGTPIWAGRGPGEPERAEQHIGAPTPPAAPAGGGAAD